MNYGAMYEARAEDGAHDLRLALDDVAQDRGHSQTLYADDWSVGFVIAVCENADAMTKGHEGLFREVSTFLVELTDRRWRFSTPAGNWVEVEGTRDEQVAATRSGFLQFLEVIEPAAGSSFLLPNAKVQLLVEEFVTRWRRVEDELQLDAETRIVADALVSMVAEVAKADEPPAGILREAFGWLGRKLDVFADEAFATAGKAAGVAVPGMVVAGLTGNLPRLTQLAHMILSAT